VFFLLVPYHVDVPMRCVPWANWVLLAVTVLCYPLGFSAGADELILGRGSLGYVGHMFLHADVLHLLMNMVFLWVFGNAVCAKLGNLVYPVVYVGLGVAAGFVAQLADPRPAVGASGAINGVVGLFVVWYLLNDISCGYVYWFLSLAGVGTYSVSSYWMVLLWAAFDVWGAVRGGGNIGYYAHLGGFATGFVLAVVLLKIGLIEMERGERSLLQVLAGGDDDPKPVRRRRG